MSFRDIVDFVISSFIMCRKKRLKNKVNNKTKKGCMEDNALTKDTWPIDAAIVTSNMPVRPITAFNDIMPITLLP